MPPWDALRTELAAFKTLPLLSSLAALQLLPDNAHSMLRLEFLVHLAAGLPVKASGRHVLKRHLEPLCTTALELADVLQYEDPQSEPFVETLGFHGGNHRLVNGVFTRSAVNARLFAESVNALYQRHDLSASDRVLVEQGMRLFIAALTLSDTVVRRARLHPGIVLDDVHPGDFTVPANTELDRLRQAVTYPEVELAALLTPLRVSADDLAPLVCDLPIDLTGYDLGSGPLLMRPLGQVDGRLVVLIPGALLPAACHAVASLFVSNDRADLLDGALGIEAWRQVSAALDMLGAHPLPEEFGAAPTVPPGLQEGVYDLDVDKVMYVVLLRDTIADYAPDALLGGPGQPVDGLDDVLRDRVEYLYRERPGINDIFVLVVTQTFRSDAFIAFDGPGDLATVLPLASDELEVIARLEDGKKLRLYKFARALDDLRRSVTLFPGAGTLDAFAFYRRRHYSFYLSDEARPNALFMSPGEARPLREEAQRRWQEHFVPAPDGRSLVSVANRHHDPNCRVFAPFQSFDGRIGMLVSGLAKPLWFLSEHEAHVPAALRRTYFQFVDMLAYWGWQFTPVLTDLLSRVPKSVVSVLVVLDPQGSWHEHEQTPDSPPLDVAVDRHAGILTMTFRTAVMPLLEGSTNEGERFIVRELLQGLARLAGVRFPDAQTVDRLLDQFAPLGLKKHLLLLDPTRRPELIEGRLPEVRLVQGEDRDALLDDLAQALFATQPVGSIPDAERTALLHRVNGVLFGRFAHRVRSLAPDGLVEALLQRHEALTRDSTYHAITVPTQLACFAPLQDIATDIATRTGALATASLASRFLLEYVAAQPPTGSRPLSLTVYDELMAIASSIISFGFESDFIHFELADLPMQVLPSGRLGIDRDALERSMSAYRDVFSAGEAARATEAFPRLWGAESAGQSPADRPIDEAVRVELGVTLQDLWDVVIEAYNLADGEVMTRPRHEVAADLGGTLGWPLEKVERSLELLTLTAREDFLRPPAPFKGIDVYPWRFNRRLSFLQRPILQRGTDLVWGPRSVYQAVTHLTSLILGGRYRAETPELKAAFGVLTNERGRRFNDEVEALVRGAGYREVTPQVKKIAGLAIAGPQGTLGDVDVFVVDRDRRRLLLIECKDLASARTPAELYNEMQTLLQGSAKKKAIVELHGRRAQWFEEHKIRVLEHLNADQPEGWTVVPLVVVDTELMAASFAQSPIPVVPVHQLLRYISV